MGGDEAVAAVCNGDCARELDGRKEESCSVGEEESARVIAASMGGRVSGDDVARFPRGLTARAPGSRLARESEGGEVAMGSAGGGELAARAMASGGVPAATVAAAAGAGAGARASVGEETTAAAERSGACDE